MGHKEKFFVTGRIAVLDQLRAIAVICVLISHFSIAINSKFIAIQNNSINIGLIGVLIFFCVSGYVIPWSMNTRDGLTSIFGFWIRRVFRLYPIYIVMSILGWFFLSDNWYVSKIYSEMMSGPIVYWGGALSMMSHFLGQNTVFQGLEWTLAYEMLFYLACTVFLLLRRWLANVISLFVLVLTVSFISIGFDLYDANSNIQKILYFYLFFLSGLTCFLFKRNVLSHRFFTLLSFVLIATMFCRVLIWYKYWGVSYLTFSFIPAIFIFYSFILERIIVSSKLMPLIGVVSYSIYLMHIFVPHSIPLTDFPPVIRFLVWTIITVAIASISYKLIELPAIKMSRRIVYKKY
ncbi:acyltransferase family protein [Citrobacter sp. FDAARGOS_156]|uniref:acyltransferase family protein n=1 Tax=Citrobacter sp. FDAARGOS_156 TaxID=1702170 RepID=UPI00076B10FC|nr:acyltransferase [Citrobacter sp. FDAARGOS_156]